MRIIIFATMILLILTCITTIAVYAQPQTKYDQLILPNESNRTSSFVANETLNTTIVNDTRDEVQ